MDTPRSAFFLGVRDQAPTIPGNLTFGMIVGAASSAAGMDPWLSMGMSIIVFAGAAQLVAIQLMAQHAPAAIVVLSIAIVNLRMAMYSAAVAPFFRHLPVARRWLFSYLLTDHAFALTTARFAPDREVENCDAYYLGVTATMWCTWQLSVATGLFAGLLVPASWSLDFAVPLVFLSLAVTALQTRLHWQVALVAGLAAAATAAWPMRLGLVASAGVAIAFGAWRAFQPVAQESP